MYTQTKRLRSGPEQSLHYTYDATGQTLTGANATGAGSAATYSSTTNFGAADALGPMAGTPDVMNGHSVTQASGAQLSATYGYNSALSLTSSVAPNSATSGQTFSPTTGLLTQSVSVHGATTNYTYTFNPTTVTATTNGHWTKAYKDGFGRDLAVETGYGTTIVSHVDNVYGPCACSPAGKLTATSRPYAIGAGGAITASDGTPNIAWTTYTYDGLGRTLTTTAPDGSATTYSYLGNTTKVTDPAGNWKRYTNDALGNLVLVEEPNPQFGQTDSAMTNFTTSYTYDLMGRLTNVSMPRPYGGGTSTQTRAFNYDLATGRLMSTMNPENGTTTYVYYASGRLQSKVDAKGQKATYSYDGYGRLAYIDRYPNGTTWDPCQSVALSYDATAPNANGLGRISTAATGAYWALGLSDSTTCGGQSVTEQYGYTPGGLVTSKSYTMTRPTVLSPLYFATSGATAGYSYDNEGHMSGYGPFTYTLDAMGRPTGMTENGVGTVWVQNAAYGPGGEMKTMQYRIFSGEWYTETQTFNNRSQLIRRQGSGKGLALDLQYGYTAGANNGQIATSSEAVSGEQAAYTYDSLKRLIKAETTAKPRGPAWGQSFGYDGFGNLLTKNQTPGHTGTQMSLTVNPATNYLTTSGFAYDANENMTSMPATGGNIALGYDVENRTGGQWFDQQNQPLLRAGVWNLYGLHGERLETHTFGSALIVINGMHPMNPSGG